MEVQTRSFNLEELDEYYECRPGLCPDLSASTASTHGRNAVQVIGNIQVPGASSAKATMLSLPTTPTVISPATGPPDNADDIGGGAVARGTSLKESLQGQGAVLDSERRGLPSSPPSQTRVLSTALEEGNGLQMDGDRPRSDELIRLSVDAGVVASMPSGNPAVFDTASVLAAAPVPAIGTNSDVGNVDLANMEGGTPCPMEGVSVDTPELALFGAGEVGVDGDLGVSDADLMAAAEILLNDDFLEHDVPNEFAGALL